MFHCSKTDHYKIGNGSWVKNHFELLYISVLLIHDLPGFLSVFTPFVVSVLKVRKCSFLFMLLVQSIKLSDLMHQVMS